MGLILLRRGGKYSLTLLSRCVQKRAAIFFARLGNTISMNENTRKRIKAAIPCALLAAAIALLVGISFLPSVRFPQGELAPASAARVGEFDGEAIRILGCCEAYAASHPFSSETEGCVKARVAGIPYTQRISVSRTVDGENFSETCESASALVKAGVRRSCKDGAYFSAHGKYKSKRFEYPEPKELSRERFTALFGKPNVGIVKYVTDGTLVSATRVDDNTFSYVLDPVRATEFSRNEVKTLLGGKSYPTYESVEFTLTVNGDRAEKVVCKEIFRADKLGGITCSAVYTDKIVYM